MTSNVYHLTLVLIGLVSIAVSGCAWSEKKVILQEQISPQAHRMSHSEVLYDDLESTDPSQQAFARLPSKPGELPADWLRLSLEDAIAMSMQNTSVLRSLNAQVTTNPQSATSIYDAAIQASDPNFGTQAALAQFDSNLTASLNHANNDDVFNNSILGGGATEVVQDLTQATFGLNRTTSTGASLAVNTNVTYDNNDNPTSTFPSSYNSFWQANVRQPLLQGRGQAFNRIAGPNARVGFFGTAGFLISQINTDISVNEFERGLIRHVNEIVTAYWELHFSIRNFDAAKSARNSSLATWNTVKARFDNDLPGGEADAEAQAREQYLRFEDELLIALEGDESRGVTGVFQAEANLRRLIGLDQVDDQMIWPSDSPLPVACVYDWESLTLNALQNRVEVRQQRTRIRQRELELLAAKNFLLPRLDATATFRNNGFGDRLAGGDSRFSSSFTDLTSGDHNEWEFGLRMDMPVGFRQAKIGVRNSELQLIRDRAVMAELKQNVLFELDSSHRRSRQTLRSSELNDQRAKAAKDAYESRLADYEAGTTSVDLLLDAVERLANSNRQLERSRANYQIATARVKQAAGTLLAEFGIFLDQSNVDCGNELSIARIYSNP